RPSPKNVDSTLPSMRIPIRTSRPPQNEGCEQRGENTLEGLGTGPRALDVALAGKHYGRRAHSRPAVDWKAASSTSADVCARDYGDQPGCCCRVVQVSSAASEVRESQRRSDGLCPSCARARGGPGRGHRWCSRATSSASAGVCAVHRSPGGGVNTVD